MNHVTQPSCFADISIFSLKISRFCYIKKYRQIAIWFIISNSFNFFESLKIIIKNMGYNFKDISKNGYTRPS